MVFRIEILHVGRKQHFLHLDLFSDLKINKMSFSNCPKNQASLGSICGFRIIGQLEWQTSAVPTIPYKTLFLCEQASSGSPLLRTTALI